MKVHQCACKHFPNASVLPALETADTGLSRRSETEIFKYQRCPVESKPHKAAFSGFAQKARSKAIWARF
jgi:hypothetical protein